MTGKYLAEDGLQIQSDELGTVYMWLPRFAYCDENIAFIKEIGIIELADWYIPEIFRREYINSEYIELTGLWIEKDTYSASRINYMNSKDNEYGLISNSKVENISKIVIETLKKYDIQYPLEYLNNYTNNERTTISIINTNEREPIKASAAIVETTAYIDIEYSKYGIDKIIYENTGEILIDNKLELSRTSGFYVFIVVDNFGNTKICTAGHEENPPELVGFNVDTTFVVTYNGDTEYSKQSLRNILEEGAEINESGCLTSGTFDDRKVDKSKGKWYQYNEQKWANIVVRNAGNEAYFVWVPRYAYMLDSELEISDVVFIDINNIEARTGEMVDLSKYKIPEAFQVVEEDGTVKELSGFWTGKYLVSNFKTFGLSAEVYSGINKIRVANLKNSVVSSTNARYDLYVMKDEDIVYYVQNANKTLYEFGESTNQRLDAGIYELRIVLYDERDYYRGEKKYSVEVYNQVVNTNNEPEEPVLTGFNPSITYYVFYDENGVEDSSIPISQTLTPEQKAKWYNYAEQRWANIVVKNEEIGKTAYFVWIPRYEYHAYDGYEYTDVAFIPVTTTEASYGCKIPEAFQVVEEDGTVKELPGFWTGKYLVSR